MRRVALLALIIMFFLPAGRSNALSCAELPTVEKAYEYYDGIVIGQVDKVSRSNDDSSNEIHIRVKRSFKTITERSLILKENITWGALNGPSETGKDYLFYLKQTDGEWENPLCSPSALISSDSAGPEYLQNKELTLLPAPQPPADNSPLAEKTPIDAWTIGGLVVIGILTAATIVRYHKKRG
ncbi:hypothetical protein R70723_23310 [Paenibacillus sp. FSL R7-0273]|uniref:hypothetical protein n=1 Tax=Paenibacillus sp. FSL R7-0273 TaxID=1536772 RepID=UPI0004F8407E|nr:hypothetical protein [Paenibacillus sp. FSL R7-0273]AIQ48517.1 hypothetical protein R70723_23310 [Paenibacillus sp. FSL R7-0273]OMF87627.1 hypothetical protein BK144_23800 [Paenibacillus sp. FSL R7-0273]